MPLTEEEVKQVKEQLLKQIENFPPEQRDSAIKEIEAMNATQLEEFLVKNNLIKTGEGNCIFCSITGGETPSYKIDENTDSVAILDINPLSEGQILVLPKLHKSTDDCPQAMELAQKMSKLLKQKLKAKEVKIETTNVQGHGLINVIPIYEGKKLERKKAEDKALYELQQKLIKPTEQKEKPREIKEVPVSELPYAPIRIP